jgi:TPR repeat protein
MAVNQTPDGLYRTGNGSLYVDAGEAYQAEFGYNSVSSSSSGNAAAAARAAQDAADKAKSEAEFKQWEAEMKKNSAEIRKLGNSIIDTFYDLIEKHRTDSFNCRDRGDFDGAIREMNYFIQNINNPTIIKAVKDTIECFTENKDTYQSLKNQWEAILADKLIYQYEIALNYEERSKQKAKTEDYKGAFNDILTAVVTYPFNDQIRDGLVKMLAGRYYVLALKLGNENSESFAEDIIFNINAAHLLDSSLLDNDAWKRLRTAYSYMTPKLLEQQKYTDLFLVLHREIRLDKELNEPEDETIKNFINKLIDARPSLLELSKNEKEFNRLLITAGLSPQRVDDLIQIVSEIRVKHPAASLPRTDAYNIKSKYETYMVEQYIKYAESGDVGFQMVLGNLYANGKKGLPQDYAKAREWYRKAAEQGNAGAKAELEKLKGK